MESQFGLEEVTDFSPHPVGLIFLIVGLEDAKLIFVGDCEGDQRGQEGVFDAAFEHATFRVLPHREAQCYHVLMRLLVVLVQRRIVRELLSALVDGAVKQFNR